MGGRIFLPVETMRVSELIRQLAVFRPDMPIKVVTDFEIKDIESVEMDSRILDRPVHFVALQLASFDPNDNH